MFIYWDGYEIDGSETDFNIVLPENVQVCEFLDCFLSIPIFSDTQKPYISYQEHGSHKKRELKLTQLKEMLTTGDYPEISVMTLCNHPEQLPAELSEKIHAISERRDPHEKAYGQAENPCTEPIIYMTVELMILPPGTGHEFASKDDVDGHIYNIELFGPGEEEHPCFDINVGPGFYFEYAIFIIDYLREHFPGIGVCGGLGCDGGCGGCTYAASLYYLERILIPVEYSIRNTFKRLSEYDFVRSWSYRHYTKKGMKYEFTDGFSLASHLWWGKPSYDAKSLTFAEYIELVDTAFMVEDSPFSTTCETAIRIMLPRPEEFSRNAAALKQLNDSLPAKDSEDRNFTGYFAFTKIDGKPMAEFRIPYTMKKYLMNLFDLAESGAIDFIKSATYARRHC